MSLNNGYAIGPGSNEVMHVLHPRLKYPNLWRGCVGAWAPLLGPSGSTLRDNSGRGNHGTLVGMDPATSWLASGGKYSLDTSTNTQRVETTNDISGLFASETATLSMWIRSDDANNGAGCDLSVRASFNHYPFSGSIYYSAFNDARLTITPSASVTFSVFHHLCITRNASAWTMRQNNILIHDVTPGTFVAPTILVFNTSYRSSTTEYFAFDGATDDIRLYNRVLSQSEITLLATRRGIAYETNKRRSPAYVAPTGGTAVPVFAHHYRTLARS